MSQKATGKLAQNAQQAQKISKKAESKLLSTKPRSHTGFQRHEFKQKVRQHELIEQQRADAQLLLSIARNGIENEPQGDERDNYDVPLFRQSQKSIGKQVDVVSGSKQFDLLLKEFGPYSLDYTRNGRHLLLYGRLGHVAVFDWLTKRLTCEFHAQESVNAACWLHQETMYAVAQRQWTHIYDQQGTELHCLKKLDQVLCMTFLPQHFLLCTGNERGFLSYLDVSTGSLVSQLPTKLGRINLLTHNPANAVVNIGHSSGRISMWTPNRLVFRIGNKFWWFARVGFRNAQTTKIPAHQNSSTPVVQLQAHGCPINAVDIDSAGTFLLSSGTDRVVKLWDLRNYRVVREYRMQAGVSALAFSQRRKFAVAMRDCVQVMDDVELSSRKAVEEPLYLQHRTNGFVKSLKFCPYEDVLGVGTQFGFCSMLVPGSGEPNFDTYVADPFQTKRQRQEQEVRSLLDKLPANLISLDPEEIGKVNEASLAEKLKAREEILHIRVPKIEFTPRFRPAGPSSGSVHAVKRKQGVKDERRRATVTASLAKRDKLREIEDTEQNSSKRKSDSGMRSDRGIKKTSRKNDAAKLAGPSASVLSRFLPKSQK